VLLVRNPDLCAINTFTTSFWGQFPKPKSNTAKADGCGFQHRCVEVDVNTLIQHSQIWEFPVAKQTTRPLQIANFDFVCQLKEIIKDCDYVDYCCVIGMRNGRQTKEQLGKSPLDTQKWNSPTRRAPFHLTFLSHVSHNACLFLVVRKKQIWE